MPKTDLLPVFWKEQDDSWEKPAFIWSREEARLRKKAKLGWFENHGKTFRLYESAPASEREFRVTPESLKRSTGFESDAAISFAEMMANVGIVEDNVKNPGHVILSAQEKVRAYARLVDQKSPLAFGRAPNQIPIENRAEA